MDFGFKFDAPFYGLLFLVLLITLYLYHFYFKNQVLSVLFPSLSLLNNSNKSFKEKTLFIPKVLRWLSLSLLIIALMRPQSTSVKDLISSEGIDIALVLDISSSMLSEDFRPNRIEAAKRITDDFITNRISDQIGLVIFSRDAFTQCPLTIDYSILKSLLKNVKSGIIEDGTAIGNAVANGINRLKDSKAKSKVMILLTDGMNNAGEIAPLTAAEIAKQYGIRIYTIGVGSIGQAPYPFQTPFGVRYQMIPVEIDEKLLNEISRTTNGKYFRAINNKSLENIYSEIDKLEKTKYDISSYTKRKEYFPLLLIFALSLLVLEFILLKTYYKVLP